MWSSVITIIMQGLSKLITPVLIFFIGRKSKEAKQDKADANILEKQRDNNISTLDGADSFWLRTRKRKDRK